MNKTIIALSLLIFGQFSFAATQGFFNDSHQVTVLIQGKVGDPDAATFFNSMNIAAVEDPNFFIKDMTYTTTSMQKTMSLLCKMSKRISYSSCTLKLYKSPWTVIGDHSVLLSFVGDVEAEQMSNQFVAADVNGDIYQSIDHKLVIKSLRDGAGKISFSISYK